MRLTDYAFRSRGHLPHSVTGIGIVGVHDYANSPFAQPRYGRVSLRLRIRLRSVVVANTYPSIKNYYIYCHAGTIELFKRCVCPHENETLWFER